MSSTSSLLLQELVCQHAIFFLSLVEENARLEGTKNKTQKWVCDAFVESKLYVTSDLFILWSGKWNCAYWHEAACLGSISCMYMCGGKCFVRCVTSFRKNKMIKELKLSHLLPPLSIMICPSPLHLHSLCIISCGRGNGSPRCPPALSDPSLVRPQPLRGRCEWTSMYSHYTPVLVCLVWHMKKVSPWNMAAVMVSSQDLWAQTFIGAVLTNIYNI